jgi:hypothetical protein
VFIGVVLCLFVVCALLVDFVARFERNLFVERREEKKIQLQTRATTDRNKTKSNLLLCIARQKHNSCAPNASNVNTPSTRPLVRFFVVAVD